MLAYTGHRDDLEHGRGGQGRGQDDPGGDQRACAIAVFAIYFTLPAVALSALPVTQHADGEYQTLLGLPEEQGGYAGDPILGVVKHIDLGVAPAAGGDLRRPARRDDPLPGHQRGPDRRLAARLLDGHPPPDARRACAGCTRSTARRGSGSSSSRASRSSSRCRARRRSSAASTRSARCCRSRSRTSSVIRLRIKQPDFPRPYRGPGNVTIARRTTCRCSRSSAASFTAIAFVVIVVLNPTVAVVGVGWLVARHRRSTCSSAAARGST